MEVRTIITEALSRSNLVPRRQAAPGYQVEDAFKLLQGICSKYNNDNYLAFTQSTLDLPARRVIHIYDEIDSLKGENNLYFDSDTELQGYELTQEDADNNVWAFLNDGQHDTVVYSVITISTPVGPQYSWLPHPNQEYNARYQDMLKYAKAYHIQVPNVSKLNTLNVNRGSTYGMLKLNFLPRGEFDSYVANELYWTYTEGAEGEWLIEIKPYVATAGVKLRLEYNKGFKIDLDTDLRIPDAYLELLTVALTHKLAIKYPRLDADHMNRLEKEVATMLDNVRTPKADTKSVKRENDYTGGYSANDVMVGRMFWGI